MRRVRLPWRPAGIWAESPVVLVCAAAVSLSALAWCLSHGYTLADGDAESHLNIARRILDSRTPGIDQFGTGWLPFQHALMLPLVWNDRWWQSGLAGGAPSAFSFIVACVLMYAAVRRLFLWPAAGAVAVAAFALNPNILYLQSAAMNETAFLATLVGLLFTTVWFRQTGSPAAVIVAGVFSNAATLTRYDGWFLIPFVTAFFFIAGGRRRWWAGVLFGAIASAAPLAWFGYNWWFYRNPFEFYTGPYSTGAIYERAVQAGGARQPGDHDWLVAMKYFWAAATLVAGAPLAWLGVLGAATALWKGRRWAVLLLALPPVFYVWSIHSSGAQIFVPALWPHSYYNTRYGTAILPLFAMGAGALVVAVPRRFRTGVACAVPVLAIAPWAIRRHPESWGCPREPMVNSAARRAWTAAAARYIKANYHAGDGIFTSFGDLTGILREAGVPLREALHEGNNPQWMAAERRPGLFLKEGWAIAFAGDPVATAVQRANRNGPMYTLVALVQAPGADVIEIYRRSGGDWALSRLCAAGLIANCDPQVHPTGTGENDENSIHEGPRGQERLPAHVGGRRPAGRSR